MFYHAHRTRNTTLQGYSMKLATVNLKNSHWFLPHLSLFLQCIFLHSTTKSTMQDNSGVDRLTSLFFFLTRNFYPYFFFVCVGSYSEPFYVVNFPHPNSFHQTVVSLPKLIAFLHFCSAERNIHQFLPPVVLLHTQTTNLMYNILYHTNGRESVKKQA